MEDLKAIERITVIGWTNTTKAAKYFTLLFVLFGLFVLFVFNVYANIPIIHIVWQTTILVLVGMLVFVLFLKKITTNQSLHACDLK